MLTGPIFAAVAIQGSPKTTVMLSKTISLTEKMRLSFGSCIDFGPVKFPDGRGEDSARPAGGRDRAPSTHDHALSMGRDGLRRRIDIMLHQPQITVSDQKIFLCVRLPVPDLVPR